MIDLETFTDMKFNMTIMGKALDLINKIKSMHDIYLTIIHILKMSKIVSKI